MVTVLVVAKCGVLSLPPPAPYVYPTEPCSWDKILSPQPPSHVGLVKKNKKTLSSKISEVLSDRSVSVLWRSVSVERVQTLFYEKPPCLVEETLYPLLSVRTSFPLFFYVATHGRLDKTRRLERGRSGCRWIFSHHVAAGLAQITYIFCDKAWVITRLLKMNAFCERQFCLSSL